VLAVGKTLERSNGIVTDRRDAESLFPDCIEMLLQLTSWILQNGHQSAERKKTSMAPLGPMIDLRS
jgi:hypothetical protein